MRVVLPGPSVISRPAAPSPPGAPVGDMGTEYGIQSYGRWQPGDTKAKQLIDVRRTDALWRVSAFGTNVSLRLSYGTTKLRTIEALQPPLVIAVPGQLILTVTPLDDAGAECIVALTYATAGAIANARKFIDGAVAVALDAGAVRYFALTASTLTISGAAVAVPACSFVPLVVGSVLNSGSGFQEFEA
jgi:hypothetical protein